MAQTTKPCNAAALENLLAGSLNDEQVRKVEDHLDSCAACRDHLQSLAADDEQWREFREHLSDSSERADEYAVDEHRSADERSSPQYIVGYLAPTDDPHMLGRLGVYEIAGVIGSGGMGIVLKGFDRALNRPVAIKLLAPHLAASGAARRRFSREAQAAAAVVHDNVVAIHGVSEAQGLPFLVMPYIRGESLQKRIDERGPLEVREVLRIGHQIAAGLAAAHAQGLVHRDIKPANILIEEGTERLHITDFGLARAAADADLTGSGILAGTPEYMSPEQARGEGVDARSDLFSLGSVLYATCTGRPPFRAETSYGVLRRIIDTQPRPIREINSDVPSWLTAIIGKLQVKNSADRWASAGEVAELFGQCLGHLQQPDGIALPARVTALTPKQPYRLIWRWAVVVVAAAACLSLVVVYCAIGTSRPPPDAVAVPWPPPSTSEQTPSPDSPMTELPVFDDDIADRIQALRGAIKELDSHTIDPALDSEALP